MSQRELYLHIGTHKTGTTALQQFFAANRGLLRGRGIVYPCDMIGGGEAGHYRLSWAVQSETGIVDKRFPADLQSPVEEWDVVLKQCDCPKALVSTEGFWDCQPEHLYRIKELTSEFAVKIVVYVRRQDHFEDAWYNQLVKDLRCMKTPLAGGMFPTKEKFALWSDIFGRDNIILRPYEKGQFYTGTIFSDFLHAAWGLELTDAFILPEKNSNPRLHRIALEYRRLVNQLPLAADQKFMTLTPLLQVSALLNEQGRTSDPVLPPQARLEVVRRYANFYSEIARDYLGRKDGQLFHEPLPDINEKWQPYHCLLAEDAGLINAYLAEHWPKVKDVILSGIGTAKKSDDPEVRDAAKQLMPGIFAPCTISNQTNTLQDEDMDMQIPQKELYIHVGTHKTGTTALQHFFSLNREVLRKKGIEYPNDVGGEAGQHRLGWSFQKERGRPCRLAPSDMGSSEKEWALAIACGSHKILISSETLCKCNSDNIRLIKKYTSGYQVKIIIYFRRQDTMANSMFNQIIKASDRKVKDYNQFIYKMNYLDFLKEFAEVFGKESIIVRPYEKQQFYNGTIFADFLFYALRMELTDEFEIPKESLNSRLHRVVLEYKRLVNFLPMTPQQIFDTLYPLLEISCRYYQEEKADYPLLSPLRQLEVIHQYDVINQQVAREYLGRENGKLFYDPLPQPEDDWQPCERLDETDARLINHYLTERHPRVMCTIIQGILDSLSSEDAAVCNAVDHLLPGILDSPAKCRNRHAALERRRAEIAGILRPQRFVDWLRRTMPEPLKKPTRIVIKKIRQMSRP
jgi:hypothetical protein